MHLAYSTLNHIAEDRQQIQHHQSDNELVLRYLAHEKTCNKYRNEIAAIQKYLPGWLPKFR